MYTRINKCVLVYFYIFISPFQICSRCHEHMIVVFTNTYMYMQAMPDTTQVKCSILSYAERYSIQLLR